MIDLGAFLQKAGKRVREAGVWDCCAMPGDWAVACGHADPMAAWRGAYDTEERGDELIAEAGGLDVLYAHGMAAAEIPSASPPWLPGDIAVVSVLGRQAGCIFTGKRWAFVAERGVALASLDDACILRVWRVQNG